MKHFNKRVRDSKLLMTVGMSVMLAGVVLFGNVKGRANVHSPDNPVVTGYGIAEFQIGELLYKEDFENLDKWKPQIQVPDSEPAPEVENVDDGMSVFIPEAGATIWYRNKIEGPVAILYDVRCPPDTEGVVPRDINSFWHATDPEEPARISDEEIYDGGLGSYWRLNSYYASTGGRDNTTIRFRRFPSRVNDDRVPHVALSHRDHQEDFLIEPGKTHTVQLVAYNDIVQYIVDGKVVYQIREGSLVEVVGEDGAEEVVYDTDEFPVHEEGWFGFRIARSHHIYSNFRVYRLDPLDE